MSRSELDCANHRVRGTRASRCRMAKSPAVVKQGTVSLFWGDVRPSSLKVAEISGACKERTSQAHCSVQGPVGRKLERAMRRRLTEDRCVRAPCACGGPNLLLPQTLQASAGEDGSSLKDCSMCKGLKRQQVQITGSGAEVDGCSGSIRSCSYHQWDI